MRGKKNSHWKHFNACISLTFSECDMCAFQINTLYLLQNCVCVLFTPAVGSTHLLFGHMLLSCWLLVLQWRAAMQTYFVNEISKKTKQITSSFLVLSLHRQFIVFSYFPVLEACLNTNSQGPPAARHGATSVIMRCLGLQEPTCVHVYTRVCACHAWHSTPAGSVIVCSLGRIGLLNCSGGSRNALIYTVLCLWVCKPPCFRLMTDLLTCSRRGGMGQGICHCFGKSLFCQVWVVYVEPISPILSFTSCI